MPIARILDVHNWCGAYAKHYCRKSSNNSRYWGIASETRSIRKEFQV